MRSRVLLTAGLALAAVLHGSVLGQVAVPALAMVLALAAVVAGPRLQLAQASQALVLVATAGLVLGLAVVDAPLSPRDGGPKLPFAVFSGTALLTVATRLWLREPERGEPATWVIGLLAFTACGRVVSDLYLPLVVAYLGLAWLHAAWRPGGLRAVGPRHVATGLALVLATTGLASGATLGLRRLYQALDTFILGGDGDGTVGFGAGAFRLGSMDGLRDSDQVILRVHGPADAHFRGQAYSQYGRGFWLPPDGEATPAPRGDTPEGTVTLIEFVDREQERLFLPPQAASVAVEPRGLSVDALGIPRLGDGDPPISVRLDTTGPPRFPSPPPTEADLAVPPDIAAAIGPLVRGWTRGATTPAERLARITEHLEQDYTYSLQYERDALRDPVVQFLTTSRLGHCEYFASGLAMAARTAGVPTRVVTGFRSTESSPFGGHRIVRGRDAHAWVEAWVDGAWVLADPSPRNAVASTFLAGATDDARVLWQKYGLQALAAVLLVVFVGLQIRTLLRDRKPREPSADEGWVEGPPPYLAPLLDVLAQAELTRRPDECVEAFADRAEAAGRAPAGALLRRYAALRYGGVGDPSGLAGDVQAWLPVETGAGS